MSNGQQKVFQVRQNKKGVNRWKLIGTAYPTKQGGLSIHLYREISRGANIVTIPIEHEQPTQESNATDASAESGESK